MYGRKEYVDMEIEARMGIVKEDEPPSTQTGNDPPSGMNQTPP